MNRVVGRLRNVVIFGAPGSGKGTIAKKIVRDFAFKHISSGDLLRHHISENTALGKAAKSYMDEGKLVPDELIVNLIKDAVKPSTKDTSTILLDGFPRTLDQAKALHPVFPVDVVLQLDVPDSVIKDRMAQRWIHFGSGKTYSYDYNPPKVRGFDDETGEPLEQREDDKPEVVQRRLDHYHSMLEPLIGFYSTLPNCRVMKFSGSESDVIYPKVLEFLGKELLFVKP